MSPTKPSSRRRGAQPGNTNALKHGFFARKDRPAPMPDLIPLDQGYAWWGDSPIDSLAVAA